MKRAVARLAGALLYLYPPAFRRAHGHECRQFVRAALVAEPAGRVLACLLVDVARSLPREWLDTVRWPRPAASRSLRPTGEPMLNLVRDLRYAARLLRRSPGFTLAAVTTLALGIGANTAIFSLAWATLVRPVHVPDPDRVVAFSWSSSFPDYEEYAARGDLFSGVVGVAARDRISITIDGVAEIRAVTFLSGGGFEVLGVGPALGRTLQPSDDMPGAPVVAVLSHDYWRTRFGGRGDVVGRAIQANGRPVTIVGVASQGFRGTSLSSNPHLFLPLTSVVKVSTGFFALPGILTMRGASWLTVFGRLKEGVTVAQATSALETQYRLQHPPSGADDPERLRLVPLGTRALGSEASSVRRFVLLLTGVVWLTLLVGCANLANLLLARVAARRRELGVRVALGASRGRVVRLMLAESVLLSTLGGAAGLSVAVIMMRLLSAYQLPGDIAIETLVLGLDRTVLGATAAISIAVGLIFGAAPAWRAARVNVLGSLGNTGRGASAPGGIRATLLAGQVALCIILLAGSGLFLRSLVNALNVPLGYRPEQVALASVSLPLARFDPARAETFYAAVIQRATAMPGVTAVSWSTTVPSRGGMSMDASPDGHEPAAGEDMHFYAALVGPQFFTAAGTRIIAGRPFADSDNAGAPLVAIVNQTAARRFYGGAAVGRRIKVAGDGPWFAIVGVAEDTTVGDLGQRPDPYVYFPLGQPLEARSMLDAMHLLVRTTGDPKALLPFLASELRSADAGAPVYDVRTFDEAVRGLVEPQRMGMMLLGCFSVLALALATLGIYGVASYGAALRTREIGIRLALGSGTSEIRALVLGHGARPVVAGLVVGLALALWASRLASAFLYGVSPRDPATFAIVAILLGAVALVALYIPARRASRTDPIVALRAE